MRERLEGRLRELRTEFEAGQKMLAELEAKQANLRETLLRISGAIQVLDEILNSRPQPAAHGVKQPGDEVAIEEPQSPNEL
jgi:predicted nuclease with TOPRIM domain